MQRQVEGIHAGGAEPRVVAQKNEALDEQIALLRDLMLGMSQIERETVLVTAQILSRARAPRRH